MNFDSFSDDFIDCNQITGTGLEREIPFYQRTEINFPTTIANNYPIDSFYDSEDYPSTQTHNPEYNQYTSEISSPSQDLESFRNQKAPFTVEKSSSRNMDKKSKKIDKDRRDENRRLAKEKKMSKQILLEQIPEKYVDPMIHTVTDPKEQKKLLQKMRNRLSAQNSRNKKKEELQGLEAQNDKLEEENQRLREENRLLKDKDEQNNSIISALRCQIEQLLNKSSNFGQNSSSFESPILDREISSDLSSPRITRGSGFFPSGSFAYTFCILGIICSLCILSPKISTDKRTTTLLGIQNPIIGAAPIDCEADEMIGYGPNYNKVQPLIREFEAGVNQLYREYKAEKSISNSIILDPKINNSKVIINNSVQDFALTNSDSLDRRMLEEMPEDKYTSLVCQNTFEFINKHTDEIQNYEFNAVSKLPNAEYVQLLLPKSGMSYGFRNENVSAPAINQEENSMIEVWVKVIAIQEKMLVF